MSKTPKTYTPTMMAEFEGRVFTIEYKGEPVSLEENAVSANEFNLILCRTWLSMDGAEYGTLRSDLYSHWNNKDVFVPDFPSSEDVMIRLMDALKEAFQPILSANPHLDIFEF